MLARHGIAPQGASPMGGQTRLYMSLGMLLTLYGVLGWWGLALGVGINLVIWWIMFR
jgi:hypothetical protein